MKVTTLVDNSRGINGLASEWGLSLLIEANERRVLFDFGLSSSFMTNAEKLQLDLSKVDIAVLSHGHYDHGGGLSAFFAINDSAPLYLRTTADGNLYGKFILRTQYVGLDRRVMTANQARLRWVDKDVEILSGLHLLVSLPNSELRPDTRRTILVKTDQGFIPDEFRHELVLVVKEKDGISVITGCGHQGILNMVCAAKEKFPGAQVKSVIGGFHMTRRSLLSGAPMTKDEIATTARRLAELGCRRIISGHCTQKMARAILRKELQDIFSELKTGTSFEV